MSATSPYERLEAEYRKHPSPEPFVYYVRLYAAHGFVFARPDFFAMGRSVPRNAPAGMILDDEERFHGVECDCWYIRDAAGNMARIWQIVPWPLPWVCWRRINDPLAELTFVKIETLKRLCPPDLGNLR